jgi:hypothetical protein
MIIWLALVCVLAPIAAQASSTPTAASLAEKDCRALRANMGALPFKQAFGGGANAFGKCVSKLSSAERSNLSSANSLCSAEQADLNFAATHSGKTFDEFYGTGPQHSNAFGNCVSLKARNSSAAARHGLNPAKSCVALRTTMTATLFKQSFGTNVNHSNAMGKCVSIVARAQSGNLNDAASACLAEVQDTGFAASHDGKTFAQFYGTNSDLSNAFGNCVLQKLKASNIQLAKSLTNAAKTCKALKKNNPTTFRARYGTKPNAFAKCVSAQSHVK